jgi:DNA adenine methylase
MTIKDAPKVLSKYPNTRYMGSKQKLVPTIAQIISQLSPGTALDAFAGSGCIAYLLKEMGVQVTSNDFLKFSYHIANASIANSQTKLTDKDIDFLINTKGTQHTFIQDKFKGLYFSDDDNEFLDNLWWNIQDLRDEYKKSLAFAAISRACIKRRPRGMFAYTGFRYDDGRKDLTLTLKEHFVKAAVEWNDVVQDNGKKCSASNKDVFELEDKDYDLVYIDPPYVSNHSDNDYTRRYHFVEGFITYWQDVEIQEHTKTKKIKSKPTRFSSKTTINAAFDELFGKFPNSTLLVSYSSNSIPTKEEMILLLKKHKSHVELIEVDYKYSFGTHNHKIGDNMNTVSEYLFIAK